MNMSSNIYKLVNDSGMVIAEGSAQSMNRLRKKTPNTTVWVSPSSKIGDVISHAIKKPVDPFLKFAENINSDPLKKKFIDHL